MDKDAGDSISVCICTTYVFTSISHHCQPRNECSLVSAVRTRNGTDVSLGVMGSEDFVNNLHFSVIDGQS